MRLLIIEKKSDEAYEVTTYSHADGSPDKVTYATLQEVQKVLPILSKDISGLTTDSDRVTVFFNEDGSVDRIDAHVFSTNRDEEPQAAVLKAEKLSEKAVVAAVDTVAKDVAAKTGDVLAEPAEPLPPETEATPPN